MVPGQDQEGEDGPFSFGNTAGVVEDDLLRVQMLMGGHERMHRTLNGRYDPWPQRGHRISPPEIGRDRHGARQLFNCPPTFAKSQVMAAYRREMMSQAEGMPEGTYELSLRDIVELPKPVERDPERDERPRMEMAKKRNKMGKWKEHIMCFKSTNPGDLLLKMSFPLHFVGRRKPAAVAGSKVSPKPIAYNGNKPTTKSSESEDMSRSSSGGGSTSSSSDGSTSSRKMSGCYSLLSISRRR